VITLRRISLAWHLACIEEMKNAYMILVRKLKRSDHLQNLGVGRSVILKTNSKKLGLRVWNVFIRFRMWSTGGLLWTQ